METFIKKLFYAVCILTGVSYSSCGNDDKEEVPIIAEDPKLEILSEESIFNFTAAGNSAKVLKFTTNRDWEITRNTPDDDWLTVFDSSGKAGEGIKLWVAAMENLNTDGRSASFTLSAGGLSKTFEVYQAQKNAVLISNPDAFKDLDASEHYIEVEFATNAGEYKISAPSWIVETPISPLSRSEMITSKVRLKVSANDTYSLRNGVITITSKEHAEAKDQLIVSQQGKTKPEISILNKEDFNEISYEKATKVLRLESNMESLDKWAILIDETGKDWISVNESEEEFAFKITVEGNTGSERSSVVTIYNVDDPEIKENLEVNQLAAPGVLISIINKKDLSEKLTKYSGQLKVECNIDKVVTDWGVRIQDGSGQECQWMRVVREVLVGGFLYVEYDVNTLLQPRSATITIYNKSDENMSDNVKVVQEAGTQVVIEGSLKETLQKYGLEQAESLELKGNLTKDDWNLLKTMATTVLKKIDLSAVSNTTIPEKAFQNCKSLETILFPAHGKLEVIYKEAFSGCTSLKGELRIPEGVEYIDHHAFANCRLEILWFPSTVKELCAYSFEQNKENGVSTIREIHLKTKPLNIKHAMSGVNDTPVKYNGPVFYGTTVPASASVFVPMGYKSIYLNPTLENLGIVEWPNAQEMAKDYNWRKDDQGSNIYEE